MEKIAKASVKNYTFLRLFKNDIIQIYNICKENCNEVTIVANDYKLDNIEELDKINDKVINEFETVCCNPNFKLTLTKDSATMSLDDINNIKLVGLGEKINEILSKRKSFLRFFASYWTLLTIPFIILILFCFITDNAKNRIISFLLILFIPLSGLGWTIWMRVRRHCLVYLSDYPSIIGFFKRNKDSILLLFFGALIGTIFTLITNLIISK